jgi:hypothetical protein
MTPDCLHVHYRPTLDAPRLAVGFSGWMDGGEVSTGTIDYLVKKLGAKPFATISPADFYVYNYPGSMEVSAMFRPHTVIEDGLVDQFTEPSNTFYCSEAHNMILFAGREPNMRWGTYGDALFSIVSGLGVSRMCFVGSVAGLVPHTRAPFFYSTATSLALRAVTENLGLNPTNYDGPASFGTYLITRAKQAAVEMATIVAGVPAYVEGRNATCIEAAVEKVALFLELEIETNDLKIESKQFIDGLNKIVDAKPEFREHVKKLEEAYEEQSDDTDLDEVREWFQRQGMERN